MNIYSNGFIYEGTEKEIPLRVQFNDYGYLDGQRLFRNALANFQLNLSGCPNFPVIGSHTFKEGEDVTGKYELRYQKLTIGWDEKPSDISNKWTECLEDDYNLTKALKRIVAIPIESPTSTDTGQPCENCKGYGHVLNPKDPTDGRTCPECNGTGIERERGIVITPPTSHTEELRDGSVWKLISEGLPEDATSLCLFISWKDEWKTSYASYFGTIEQAKNHREYDLKNHYTHYMIIQPPKNT